MKPTEIILAFATLVTIASCTQSTTPTCIVEGNLTGLEGDGWVYMTDMWNDGEVIDSTEYHNVFFRFEVSAEEPTMVFLHADCFAHLHRFFNDPGIITLTGSAEDARIRIYLRDMCLAMPGISCIKAALALYAFLRKPQKATIYNSGLPQDSRHFYKMPRDLPLRQSSGTWAATSVQ